MTQEKENRLQVRNSSLLRVERGETSHSMPRIFYRYMECLGLVFQFRRKTPNFYSILRTNHQPLRKSKDPPLQPTCHRVDRKFLEVIRKICQRKWLILSSSNLIKEAPITTAVRASTIITTCQELQKARSWKIYKLNLLSKAAKCSLREQCWLNMEGSRIELNTKHQQSSRILKSDN